MTEAHIHSSLMQYGGQLPDSLSDNEPTADERNGIMRRLTQDESVRFEISPGVIIEVKGATNGIEVRELGMGTLRDIVILPRSSNSFRIETMRV